MHGLHPGSRLDGYRIDAVEREGDGAAVLRACDLSQNRPVALHVAGDPPGALSSARFLERARRLGSVDHPNLLGVYAARTLDGRAVAVAQLPPGQRLDVLLTEGPIGTAGAIRIARQLASAVDALEAAGEAPPTLAAERVWVDGAGDAHLDALDARMERAEASSAAELAKLIDTMTEDIPPALAPVITRACDGAYLSTGQLADDLGTVQAGAGRRRRRIALTVAIAATLATAGIVLESVL